MMRVTFATFAAALVASAALLSPLAAHAQAGAYYVATPEAQPVRTSLITRSTLWNRAGASYVAQRAPERAELLCQMVADHAGPLSAFSAGGTAFDADALARCNAKAKGAAAPVVAAAH